MTPEQAQALLIEEAAGAYRPVRQGQVGACAAWHDLDEEGRTKAYELAVELRQLEAALDPEGLSTTAQAVLQRILRAT